MRYLVAMLLLGSSWSAACGQGLEYVKAHYTKHEYRIPMRDGVKLYTAVYVPKDTTARYPFLINRSRYGVGSYGADKYARIGTAESLRRDPYIFVFQDVRGSFMSEGKFVDMTP